MFADHTLSLIQAIGLVGLLQAALIAGYVLTKARQRRQALPAAVYFGQVALVFGLLVVGWPTPTPAVHAATLWVLAFGPVLTVLLILQVAHEEPPHGRYWLALLLPVACLPLAAVITALLDGGPDTMLAALRLVGMIAGALALLLIWLRRGLLTEMRGQLAGRERYWLAIALVGANLAGLIVDGAALADLQSPIEAIGTRALLGLAFLYLATTLLFRIYPQPVPLTEDALLTPPAAEIDEGDRAHAARIDEALRRDALWRNPDLDRAELAALAGLSENAASRAINAVFGKGVRAYINGFRVAEACDLLHRTGRPVTVIAFDVGFNSLASFNRVFREQIGCSPTEYRTRRQKPVVPAPSVRPAIRAEAADFLDSPR